jgi:ribulose 1,5-bisphosphate carboxylase large subunit-like protein
MKRDLGLIRELLLKLEAISGPDAWHMLMPNDPRVQVEGRSEDEIEYHLQMLVEQGLIEVPQSQPMIGIGLHPVWMTRG